MNLINMLKNIGYEEFIPALPEQIKIELAKKEHTQILRNRMMMRSLTKVMIRSLLFGYLCLNRKNR